MVTPLARDSVNTNMNMKFLSDLSLFRQRAMKMLKASSTTRKRSSKKAPSTPVSIVPREDQLTMIFEWMLANDKAWWVGGVTAAEIVASGSAPFPVDATFLMTRRGGLCKWWGTDKKCRQPFLKEDLDQDGWDEIRREVINNDELLSEDDSTFDFCLKFLLFRKVRVNRLLLLNCAAFHRITNQRHRPESWKLIPPQV